MSEVRYEPPDYYERFLQLNHRAYTIAKAAIAKLPHLHHICEASCHRHCHLREKLMLAMFKELRSAVYTAVRASTTPWMIQHEYFRHLCVHVEGFTKTDELPGMGGNLQRKFIINHLCLAPTDSVLFGPIGHGEKAHEHLMHNADREQSIWKHPDAWIIPDQKLFYVRTKEDENNCFIVAPDAPMACAFYSKLFRMLSIPGVTQPLGDMSEILLGFDELQSIAPLDDFVLAYHQPQALDMPEKKTPPRVCRVIGDRGLLELGFVPARKSIHDHEKGLEGPIIFKRGTELYPLTLPGMPNFIIDQSKHVGADTVYGAAPIVTPPEQVSKLN